MSDHKQVRLPAGYAEGIKLLTAEIFGERSKVYLFGSRTNLNAKGGDIDLYIVPESQENLIQKKRKFSIEFQKKFGEQKVDIVLASKNHRPIDRVALETGVLL
ncbi:MAG: nucleotidyltransferase domain-containing protein [Candidatus Hydrogenedentota bacterium]|nr:MAG: nucleotidyltransferase domain-containing protein [Candidatus Hydrogenedentota bacterium]